MNRWQGIMVSCTDVPWNAFDVNIVLVISQHLWKWHHICENVMTWP